MKSNHNIKCEVCNKNFTVVECVPRAFENGGIEREYYNCPYCNNEVGYISTRGLVKVEKINSENNLQ